ncbi:hypothetical protein I8748_17010 [Nostoc sp. CENA67]|uniref:Uncharacterized protein n=1 Tax=Amazonocrinis nigriterrae CENA67 TaxID=2794033 RepID=A0A8J7HTJ0_9NOST|nr:hypothetical protein [Amazonocrinis nigriterrae]MBH8563865.1 hypothetical protein [Amazonocrinis nigriterrae CENA67]
MKHHHISYLADTLQAEPSAISVSLESEIKRLPFPESEIVDYYCRLARNSRLEFCDGKLEKI